MASTINASTNGLVTSGDNTGILNIQVNGNTALSVNLDKSVSFSGGGVTKNIQEIVNISATAAFKVLAQKVNYI